MSPRFLPAFNIKERLFKNVKIIWIVVSLSFLLTLSKKNLDLAGHSLVT